MEGYNISSIATNENQLHHEVVGLGIGLNNFAVNDSAARLEMVTSHLSQMTVIAGAMFRRLYTGIEREYGKATFKAEMAGNGQVICVANKFRGGVGKASIPAHLNPTTYIIYQDLDKAERGEMHLALLEVPTWHWLHQSYGFRYNLLPDLKRITNNTMLQKGTVLAQSPNVCPVTGDYKFGHESKIAYMSLPGIIEDGFIVREGLLKELAFKSYGKVMFGWGKGRYPINVYGDSTDFKSFPDVGELVRPDGLIHASREYDEFTAGIEMSVGNMSKVDEVKDKTIYVPPGAKIIDVQIMRNHRSHEALPDEMNAQAKKYHDAQIFMAERINNTCKEYQRKYGNITLSDTLHHLQVRNLIELGEYKKANNKTFRANLIDDWTVTVTYELDEIPTIGYKITGIHGDKGVICSVWPDAHMPRDKYGTVVDIIKDGDSTIKRMNSGAVYEHYNGASLDQVDRIIKQMAAEGDDYTVIYNWLLNYYKASSPYYYQLLVSRNKDIPEYQKHVQYVLDHGVTIFLPPNSPTIGIQQIRDLEEYTPIKYGPLTYVGRHGTKVTTKNDIMIGSAITIVLEKTGSIWSAVSSAKRQHFGFLTKLTNSNKLGLPWREAPTRFTGEAEVRLMLAYTNASTVAEILNLNNDPNAMRHLVRNRVKAETPTALAKAIDWDVVGRDGHRGVNYVRNMLSCGGVDYGRLENA